MAFCTVCGAQVSDGTTTCPACSAGALTTRAAAQPVGGISDNIAGMLAYVTIVPAIIFLVMEPYNRSHFVRFHSFQSIFLHIAWGALWIGLSIVAHVICLDG
jgi:zinc ribbon protein